MVHIIFGKATSFTTMNISLNPNEQSFTIIGPPPNYGAGAGDCGYSIGTGDFNGDSISDIVIGCPHYLAGRVYIIFGSNTPSTIDLNLLTET